MGKPTQLKAWRSLQKHAQEMQGVHLRELFAQEQKRAREYCAEHELVYLDYSKQRVTADTLKLLLELAVEAGVEQAIEQMFSGGAINSTESRPALHVALRGSVSEKLKIDGVSIASEVGRTQDAMREWVHALRAEKIKSCAQKAITDIVHIGIGGSDLGPRLAYEALVPVSSSGPAVHFVSNVDAHALFSTLQNLNPASVLFVVASKSFTTLETLLNAQSARAWLCKSLRVSEAVANQSFVAVTANVEAASAFGIDKDHVFPFWTWVGGRFSLWSSVSLSIACALGHEVFVELLAGAHAMDDHLRSAPWEKNLPVILALLGIWNRNFLGAASQAVLPHAQRLRLLPAYLQQLEMESNGKHCDRQGELITDYETAPVIWGEPGTDAQHSFFQLLHQGTTAIPSDFVLCAQDELSAPDHHNALLANGIAQSAALMLGRAAVQKHLDFPGNRTSNTLLLERLNARSLGALLALYEHKVFVQGVVWNINSFDQWGVQYGKELVKDVLISLGNEQAADKLDSSTREILKRCKLKNT